MVTSHRTLARTCKKLHVCASAREYTKKVWNKSASIDHAYTCTCISTQHILPTSCPRRSLIFSCCSTYSFCNSETWSCNWLMCLSVSRSNVRSSSTSCRSLALMATSPDKYPMRMVLCVIVVARTCAYACTYIWRAQHRFEKKCNASNKTQCCVNTTSAPTQTRKGRLSAYCTHCTLSGRTRCSD